MDDTRPAQPSLGGGAVRVCKLHVVHAPTADQPADRRLDPRGPALVLGREPGDGGLALDDPEASRRHAEVRPTAAGWQLCDLASRNGTWLDGARVTTPAPLPAGGVIRIGRTLMVLSDHQVSADDPLKRETSIRGPSLPMQRLRGLIGTLAPHPAAVLVLGETGAGKELVARELHVQSRRSGAFVPVNCSAIPAALAESELFGHVAGSFTGAAARSEGLFAAAAGGTLFLDEIGELPLDLQPKLLRALALGEVRAVGAVEPRTVNVRVVAATNRDLAAEVAAGRFRADLHARLGACLLTVPPLRDRREDILLLASGFQPGALSASAAEALLLHDWPYNVRELEQAMAAATALARGGIIRPHHLPETLAARVAHRSAEPDPAGDAPPAPLSPGEVPSEAALREALARCGGNIHKVAAALGRDRKQIYRWAGKYGIDLGALRGGEPADGE